MFNPGGKNDFLFGNGRTTAGPMFPTPEVKKPSVFEQAGVLQGDAAINAAGIESAGLEEAIALLMGIQQGGIDQFADVGLSSLADLRKGSTVSGLSETLAQIMSGDEFQSLVGERQNAIQSQLAAGGLTRSGAAIEEAAAIPTNLAFQLENMLSGRQAGLANTGLSALGQQSGIATNIANLLGAQGGVNAEGIRSQAEALAGGILGEKGFQIQRNQQKDQNRSNLLGVLGGAAGTAFGGPIGGAIGGALGSAFSDPRLKENVEVLGKIGPLDLVKWDWIDAAKDTIVGKFGNMGFMSTQVKEHFPEFVSEFGGYDVIDYQGLIGALDG